MIDKLKSIKEFKDVLKESIRVFNINHTYAFKCLNNYIDIKYRTLELGMYVPCVDGVPLEKPENYNKWVSYNLQGLELYFGNEIECEQYQQAEKNVLFKGFELCGGKAVENKELQLTVMLDSMQFTLEGSNGYGGGDLFGENIASLLFMGIDIELTEDCKQLITK